jgi:hypothetical protein
VSRGASSNGQGKQRINQQGNMDDVGHLGPEDQDAERVDEADHHRARDEPHQPRKPGETEHDLHDAGEDNRRQDVARAMQFDHRPDHQRNRAGGGRHHRWPAAENGHHKAEHDGGDQRDFGVDAGDEGERDHFGHECQRGDDSGQRLARHEIWRTEHREHGGRIFELRLDGDGIRDQHSVSGKITRARAAPCD